MYIVVWTDHEGNLHERRFKRKRDAVAEAEHLRRTYGYADIIRE